MYNAGVGNRGIGGIHPWPENFENTPPPEHFEKIYPSPRRHGAPPPFFRPNLGKIREKTLN